MTNPQHAWGHGNRHMPAQYKYSSAHLSQRAYFWMWKEFGHHCAVTSSTDPGPLSGSV